MDGPMRADDSGVAGFFEDLPVLLIVLAGIMTLVLSGVAASERVAESEFQAELDLSAERFVSTMLVSLARNPSIEHTSIALVSSVNFSRCATDALDKGSWSAALVLLSPSTEWLRVESSSGGPPPAETGYCSGLLNVVMDNGMIGIVEVSVHVWL